MTENNYPGTGLVYSVDAGWGGYRTDRRSAPAPFWTLSPDGKSRILMQTEPQPHESRSVNSLLVQHIGDQTDSQDVNSPSVVVQRGIFQADLFRPGNISWSRDSRQFAYLWFDADQKRLLTVVKADGSDKRTIDYLKQPGTPSNADAMLADWSADSRYFLIGLMSDPDNGPFTIRSAADLQRVDLGTVPSLAAIVAWSPEGHQLAGMYIDPKNKQQLILWSPEKQLNIPLDTAATQKPMLLTWSPDGRYVTLQSTRRCTTAEGCIGARALYDIFTRDGQHVSGPLEGNVRLGDTSPAAATWSADSQRWVFLGERLENGKIVQDLFVQNVAQGRRETLAANIVFNTEQNTFDLSPVSFGAFSFSAFGNSSVQTRQRLLVSTQHGDTTNIELISADGKDRQMLVEGADKVLNPHDLWQIRGYWGTTNRKIVIAWMKRDSEGIQRAHLTWANADGSGQQEISEDAQSIEQVQLISEDWDTGGPSAKWIGYVTLRDNQFTLEVANLATGQHRRVVDMKSPNRQWSIVPTRDVQLASLQTGLLSDVNPRGELYLMSLESDWLKPISTNVIGYPSWAPDNTRLAFMHLEAYTGKPLMDVIAPGGTLLHSVPLPPESVNSRNPLGLRGWTKCG